MGGGCKCNTKCQWGRDFQKIKHIIVLKFLMIEGGRVRLNHIFMGVGVGIKEY